MDIATFVFVREAQMVHVMYLLQCLYVYCYLVKHDAELQMQPLRI